MVAEDATPPLPLGTWRRRLRSIVLLGENSHLQAYTPPPAGITREACEREGFAFNNYRSAYNFLDDDACSTVRIHFSPKQSHQAVTLQLRDWAGALLWIDGIQVDVPRDRDDAPLCEPYANWADERFVYLQTGGLWDHPLLNPTKIDMLGDIRGLLIWDSAKRLRHLELPEPTQAWTHPLLRVGDDALRIYPDGKAYQANRPDRTLPI